jgi:3-oxoacyl-[acyl-carrier-protein] synthase III
VRLWASVGWSSFEVVTTIARPSETLDQAPLGPALRPGAAVAAVGISLPERIVRNHEIAARLGVGDDWIERRTGIRERHVAGAGDRLDSHCAVAARSALDRAGVLAAELDLVLVATTTADEIMPNAAPLVAHLLGADRAGAFDIGSACTGFLSAIAVGSAQIEAGRARSVVVIGADFMTTITDPDDRSTAAVFADGVGAAVLIATEEESRIGPVILGADGAGAQYIYVKRDEQRIHMAGHETFREAVARLSLATMQASAAAGVTLDEIDLFVYHQANSRILAAVGERLGLAGERVVDCIGEYGNTSAATLPLALARSEQDGRLKDGDRVLLGAFGAGFTWGATVIDWGVV